MARIDKLYRKLTEGRMLTFAEFCRLLRAFGYELERQTGSHQVWRHRTISDKRIVQPRGKDAKGYQLAQFLAIVDQHGLKLDDDDE